MTYPTPVTAADLTFSRAAATTPTGVDLTFGATSTAPGAVVQATLVGRIALRAAVSVGFDASVFRGLAATIHAPHQPGAATAVTTAAAWVPSKAQPVHTPAPFDEAAQAPSHADVQWAASGGSTTSRVAAWSATAQPNHTTAEGAWAYSAPTLRQAAAPWQEPAPRTGAAATVAYGHGKPTPQHRRAPWEQGKAQQRATTSGHNRAARAMPAHTVAPWQTALLVQSTGGPRYLPLPAPATPPRPDVLQDLRFCALYPSGGNAAPLLIFGINPCGGITPDAPLYTLPARFYMAVHSIEAHLLPSLTPVPIFDPILTADSGSFAWTLSASGPADLFDALAPTGGLPPSIRITLDGIQWVFVVDSLQRQEQFGQRRTRLAGRSATALVGSPYQADTSRLSTTARNAQQLAADALNLTGVGLDWGITDWLVPAGAWSHTGTPLAAVQAAAEAAGGYVNSHRSAPTLLVRHPYPTLPGGIPGGPWNWGGSFAADVELAPDSIITSSIERRDGPDVNGIYISGTSQGVLALVRRSGTAGSKLANMVADPLITANAAAQQRGLSVLGAAGAKHLVQMSLPVLTGASQPGVLDVGQLVQINHSVPWRGRVRAVSVQANQPTVRQSITLERHLETA